MALPGKKLLTTSRFTVEEILRPLPSGNIAVRAVVRHPGAVAIVPMVDEDHVCLIRNYRVSVDETLIEIPAGTLEPDESPADTATRELTEETGFTAGRMTALHSFFLSPGILDERMHVYLAEDLVYTEPAREPGEQIENWIVTWDEAMELINAGQIHDAKSIVGLLLTDRRRNQSRSN